MKKSKPPYGFKNVSDPAWDRGVYVMYTPSTGRLWLEPWGNGGSAAEDLYDAPTFRSARPLEERNERVFSEARQRGLIK